MQGFSFGAVHAGALSGDGNENILAVGDVAIGDDRPDLVVIFDVDQETAAHRLNPLLDRMGFFERLERLFHAGPRRGRRTT